MEDSHHNYKMFMCFTRKYKVTKAEPPLDVLDAFGLYGHDDNNSPHMNAAHLRRFMVDCQGEDDVTYTEDDASHLLHQILHRRRHLHKFTKHHLAIEDFFFFLFSDELNGPLNTLVHQDMTAPMQHYFIYTGHNSYLTGNQLSSDCSDVPIIKALKRGVRVIELDIWPNSAKDDVNVLHGGTLTAPVQLIKCLKSIKQYAFASSPYPVIITLEDHLTPDLQDKVAKMMIEVFGEMLFIPEPQHLEQFPSPEELKFHVVLSTKPPKEYLEEKQSKDEGISSPACSSWDGDGYGDGYGDGDNDVDSDGDGDGKCDGDGDIDDASTIVMIDDDDNSDRNQTNEEIDLEDKKSSPTKALECKNEDIDSGDNKSIQPEVPECKNEDIDSGDNKSSQVTTPECRNEEISSTDDKSSQMAALTSENEETDAGDNKSSQIVVQECKNEEIDSGDGNSAQPEAPQYKRLIAIHAGKPKNGLRESLKAGLCSEKIKRLSLSEQELERAAAYYGQHVVRFTQRNFLRIYPKGTRITSTNYNPVIGWMHGAQMVAFNMQGYGKFLWCMHGMFRSNGGCGYVKKPDILKQKGPHNQVFNPKAPAEVKKILKIRVYMGDGWRMDFSKTHFDAFSPPDFYVKLYIIGVAADCAKGKTRVIEDDWTPVWDQVFTFKLTVPELALLRIEVSEYDMPEKDDFAGQTCLPISELKTGIRSVPLYDRKGDKMPSVRLLMKFQFLDTAVLESLTSSKDLSSDIQTGKVEDGSGNAC